MLHVASRHNQCEVTDKLFNKAFITPAVLSVSYNPVPYHLEHRSILSVTLFHVTCISRPKRM